MKHDFEINFGIKLTHENIVLEITRVEKGVYK